MLLAGIHFDLGLLPSACSLIMDNIASQFSFSVLEFGFAITAHTHNTVVLSVLVLGTLSDSRAAAVAEQRAFAVFKFHNCMFVIHKMLRIEPIL